MLGSFYTPSFSPELYLISRDCRGVARHRGGALSAPANNPGYYPAEMYQELTVLMNTSLKGSEHPPHTMKLLFLCSSRLCPKWSLETIKATAPESGPMEATQHLCVKFHLTTITEVTKTVTVLGHHPHGGEGHSPHHCPYLPPQKSWSSCGEHSTRPGINKLLSSPLTISSVRGPWSHLEVKKTLTNLDSSLFMSLFRYPHGPGSRAARKDSSFR